MQFSVLGSCEAVGARGSLRGRLQRLLLALLIRAQGDWVAVDTLTEALWPDNIDPRVPARLHVHVHRLRGTLGAPERIEAGPRGYRLVATSDEVDAWRFEALVARALQDPALPDADRLALLVEGLELWRGPAYPGLDHCDLVAEAERLTERRLSALAERFRLDLDAGGHLRILDEVAEVARAHPARERLRALWMTALHRAGRQAEALEVYADTRRTLVDEIGIEPGPELQGLQALVLSGDGTAGAPETVPEQLPARPHPFHARAVELARLDALLDDADDTPGVVVITGAGGAGKTALALQWAYRRREQFPDGQLHVDLRGHGVTAPVEPDEVLQRFLHDLGDGGGSTPEDVASLAARFRSLVARRRLLIMLDNAASAEQVRPLLPAGGSAVVVVTSREPLTGLAVREGASTLAVDRFSRAEAADFLRSLLGGLVPCSDAEAAAISEHCGRLPLALRVAAEQARSTPGLPLTRLVDDLRDERRRLRVLGRSGDRESDVGAVLSWSLHGRSAAAQRLFGWFGLLPTAVSTASLAVFAGVDVHDVEEQLEELVRAHLVDPVPTGGGRGRYTQHDLLRAFAREQAEMELSTVEQEAAWERLLGKFLVTVVAVSERLEYGRWDLGARHLPSVRPWAFRDDEAARTWLSEERPLILAAALAAGPIGARYRPQLAEWMAGHLARHGSLHEILPLHRGAEADLRDEVDLHVRARTERAHAMVLAGVGMIQQATRCAERGLAHYREAGDRLGTATMLNHVARAKSLDGAWRQSVDLLTEGLALMESLEGSSRGRGMSLAQLGHAMLMLGEPDRARDLLAECAELDVSGQPTVQLHVGRLESRLARWDGRFDEAIELAARGVRRAEERDMAAMQAMLMIELAAGQRHAGRLSYARVTYQEAGTMARALGILHVGAIADSGLARAWLCTGEPGRALVHAQESLAASVASGIREGRAKNLARLGDACASVADPDRARGYWFEALRCYESTDEVLPPGKLGRLRDRAHGCPRARVG